MVMVRQVVVVKDLGVLVAAAMAMVGRVASERMEMAAAVRAERKVVMAAVLVVALAALVGALAATMAVEAPEAALAAGMAAVATAQPSGLTRLEAVSLRAHLYQELSICWRERAAVSAL